MRKEKQGKGITCERDNKATKTALAAAGEARGATAPSTSATAKPAPPKAAGSAPADRTRPRIQGATLGEQAAGANAAPQRTSARIPYWEDPPGWKDGAPRYGGIRVVRTRVIPSSPSETDSETDSESCSEPYLPPEWRRPPRARDPPRNKTSKPPRAKGAATATKKGRAPPEGPGKGAENPTGRSPRPQSKREAISPECID